MRTLLRDLGTVHGVQCACIVRGGEVLASSFAETDATAQATSLGFVRGVSDGLESAGRGLEELLIDFAGRSLMVTPVGKDFVLATLVAPDADRQLLRVVMGSSVRQLRRMHDIAEKPEAVAAARAANPESASKPVAAAPAPAAPRPQPPEQLQAAKAPPTGRPQPPPAPGRPAPPPPLKGQQAPRPPQFTPATQQQQSKPAAKPAPVPAPPPVAAKVVDKDPEPILPQVLALLTEYIGPVARVSFKRGVTRWRETGTPTVGTLGELGKILAADLSSDSEKKAFLDAVERLRGS